MTEKNVLEMLHMKSFDLWNLYKTSKKEAAIFKSFIEKFIEESDSENLLSISINEILEELSHWINSSYSENSSLKIQFLELLIKKLNTTRLSNNDSFIIVLDLSVKILNLSRAHNYDNPKEVIATLITVFKSLSTYDKKNEIATNPAFIKTFNELLSEGRKNSSEISLTLTNSSELKIELLKVISELKDFRILNCFINLFVDEFSLIEVKNLLKISDLNIEQFKHTLEFLLNVIKCANERPKVIEKKMVSSKDLFNSLLPIGGFSCLLPLLAKSKDQINFVLLFKIFEIIAPFTELFKMMACEDFFSILQTMLKDLNFVPCIEFVIAFKGFLNALNDKKLYVHIIETLYMNFKLWRKITEETSYSYFSIIVEHKINYFEVVELNKKIEFICDFYSKIAENAKHINKHIIYAYYSNILRQCIPLFTPERKNTCYLFIIKNLLKSMSTEESEQCINDVLKEIANSHNLKTEQEIYFTSLLELLYSVIENNYTASYILLQHAFETLNKSFSFFNNTCYRMIDFKMDYSKEYAIYEKIFSCVDQNLNNCLTEKMFKVLINYSDDPKFRIFINFYNNKIAQEEKKLETKISISLENKELINIITDRLYTTFMRNYECFIKIIQSLNEICSKNTKLQKKLVSQKNFPGWVFEFIDSENLQSLDILIVFLINLFSSMDLYSNFNKLRCFLFELISHGRYSFALKFYYKIIENENSKIHFKNSFMYLIEALNIAEDLSWYYENTEENYNIMLNVILNLSKIVEEKMYSVNFPQYPGISFFEHIGKLQVDKKNEFIVFRDGGICRQLLRLIFMLLNCKIDENLIKLLKDIFSSHSIKKEEDEWVILKNFEKKRLKNESKSEKPGFFINKITFFPKKLQKDCKDLIRIYAYTETLKCFRAHGYSQEKLSEIFFTKKCKIIDYIKSMEPKGFPSQAEWEYILTVIKEFQFSGSQQILEIPYNILAEKVKEIINNKKITDLAQILCPELEVYIKVFTSLKMLILSYKFSYLDIDYKALRQESRKKTFDSRTKSQEDISVNYKSVAISLANQKKHRKYLEFLTGIYAARTEEGDFYLKMNSDLKGRRVYLKSKKKLGSGYLRKFSYRKFSNDSENSHNYENDRCSTEVNSTFFSFSLTKNSLRTSANDKHLRVICEIIYIKGNMYGTLIIESDYMIFSTEDCRKPSFDSSFSVNKDLVEVCRTSILPDTYIPKKVVKLWNANEISEIFERRSVYSYTSIEIFFHNGKSVFINFFTTDDQKNVVSRLKSYEKFGVKFLTNLKESLKTYTKQWKKGEITNFDYIMILNKYSGRSFNDISQYPVFPWVLKEFSSPNIDFSDPKNYRDFKYPVGAQSEESRKRIEKKYNMTKTTEIYPYHHGTLFSNGGMVLYYLIRIEPFSLQSKYLQNGKFDISDRLFFSLKKCWNSTQSLIGDSKELIPEFYYFPEMFINVSKLDFKLRQNSKPVNNVNLPKWSKKSAYNFIRLHRKALESNYTSQNLQDWIDLIFGCKQCSEEFCNIFYPLTYEDKFIKSLKKNPKNLHQSSIEQVIHFGQFPQQIFKIKHPAKKIEFSKQSASEHAIKFLENQKNCLNLEYNLVIFSSAHVVMFKKNSNFITKFKIGLQGIEKNTGKDIELKGIPKSNHLMAAIVGEEFLAIARTEYSHIYINSLLGEHIKKIKLHSEYVSCMLGGNILISGSTDSSIVSVNLKKENEEKIYFHGHFGPVISLNVCENYCVLASCSSDLVILHDVRSGEILKNIDTQCFKIFSNSYGCFVMETFSAFEFFYVNGQEVRKSFAKENKNYCVLEDCLVYVSNWEMVIYDFYDDLEFSGAWKINLENTEYNLYENLKDFLKFRESCLPHMEIKDEKILEKIFLTFLNLID